MGAAIDYLRQNGLSARANGKRIIVSPASKMSTEVRQYVKSHRLELLAELTAHKLEIIEVLTTPPPESRAWLDSVAELLGCSTEHLLTRRFIDRDDLREQHTTNPRFAARLIGCNPFWTTPPPAKPANSAANDSSAPETEQQPITPTGYTLTAATALPEWRQARNQYINHLMGCRVCHAPTNRFCATGVDLRQHYTVTPMEPAS